MSGSSPVLTDPRPAAPDYVVTLVHGTFARDAAWLKRGSKLRRTIAKELGASVRFIVFRWSGDNSHQTRATAAAELLVRLRKTLARHPESKHFIIAHSHGGNIALRALDADDVRAQVLGVVAMGTPFLASKSRRADLALLILRFSVPILFFFLGLIVILIMLDKDVGNHTFQFIAIACQILATIFVKKIFRYVKGPLREKVLERQRTVDRGFQRSAGYRVNLLCGVATADEARGLLTSARMLSNAWFLLFRVLASPFRIFWILCLLFFWLIVLGVATEAVSVDHLAKMLMTGVVCAFFAALLVGPLMLVVPKVVRAHRWGFGGESVVDNALNDVSISPIPLDMECDLYAVPFAWKLRPGLPHGSYYRDRGFLKAAAGWIRWVGAGRNGASPQGVIHKQWLPDTKPRYTIGKKSLRIAVVCSTGLMALAGYFGLMQQSQPQFAARARFPEKAWWLSPPDRNRELQPGVTPWSLRSIAFWSREEGVAIGASGTVVRTLDGGKTWKAKSVENSFALSALSPVGPGQVWLLSSKGPIVRVDVVKDLWNRAATDSNPNDISFPTDRCGWAVSNKGAIQHSCDGGKSWVVQQSGTNQDLLRVRFIDEQSGWTSGKDGVLLHTTDGGASWHKQVSGLRMAIRGMAFLSPLQGWMVGDKGAIIATTDGGSTWRRQGTDSGEGLKAVAFRDGRIGVAVGDSGAILATHDGGTTWNRLWLPFAADLADITFAPDGRAWAVGESGTILAADKDGMGWKSITTSAEQTYNAVAAVSPQEAWVAGDSGVLLHTVDAGNTWSRGQLTKKVDLFNLAKEPLHGLAFPTAQSGWAVGSFGRMIHTDDGGRTWNPQDVPTLNALFTVVFPSPSEGWAAGSAGTMLHTQDSGRTWAAQATGTHANLLDLYAVSSTSLWTCGQDGTILHTDDGGRTWVAQTSGTTDWLHAVVFTSASVGTAVGENNAMRHTLDGGKTWTDASSTGEGHPDLWSMAMLSKDFGWAVGPPLLLYRDLDGSGRFGFYRDEEFKKMQHPMRAIRFADKTNGWIVGEQGGIFHTADGGSNWEQQGYAKYPAPWLYLVLAGLCVLLAMVLWLLRTPIPVPETTTA